ncbi:hypothetical protein V8C86DRAFT_2654456 [Haematococcus lacustris]
MAPSWNIDGLQGGMVPESSKRAHSLQLESMGLMKEHQYSDMAAISRVSGPVIDNSRANDVQKHDDSTAYMPVGEALPARSRFIILPDSRFRTIWVRVTLVVALYIIWVTPIRVGFDMQAQGPWFWIEGILDIFFYVDLVLNFFTAYEHPITNEVITNHKQIATRYLSTWFWIDLLATFPSDYVVKGLEGTWGCAFRNTCDEVIKNNTAVSVIVLLRTTRIFRIIWIFKNFNVLSINTIIGRLMDEYITVRWLFSIAELFVVLIFLGHLCGCFFYMFSHPKWQTPAEQEMVAAGEMSTWVLDKLGGYNIIEVPEPFVWPNGTTPVASNILKQETPSGQWFQCPDRLYSIYDCPNCQGPKLRCQAQFGFAYRYITAMYWAYTTMTTVGYGDIVGSTFAEKIWCMATMVIGGFFLSFCFGRIASIVSRLDADRAARAEQLENVTQFLRDTELPKIISRKVLDFCKTNSKSVKPYDRTAVVARMPFELRTRILQHIYLPTIQNIPLLQKLTVDEPSFLTDFSIRLQPYHSSADCFVFQRGELCTDLYILVRGEVHVVDPEKRTPLYKIQENSIFGETAVLQNIEGQVKSKHSESVYCTSAADMLRLPLEDAVELCSVYPQLLRGLARLASARQQQMRMSTSAAIPLATVSARLPTSPKRQAQCASNSALDSAVTQLGLEILAMKQELAAQQAAHAAELEQMKVMLQQLPDTISRNMHTQ